MPKSPIAWKILKGKICSIELSPIKIRIDENTMEIKKTTRVILFLAIRLDTVVSNESFSNLRTSKDDKKNINHPNMKHW